MGEALFADLSAVCFWKTDSEPLALGPLWLRGPEVPLFL